MEFLFILTYRMLAISMKNSAASHHRPNQWAVHCSGIMNVHLNSGYGRVWPMPFISITDFNQGVLVQARNTSPKITGKLLLGCNSALDKLLGQLGIYATWLSSIASLQKQLRFFIFFYATFFFCDYKFSYCMKPSGMCLHIYSLPLSAFLKHQTSGFYCT